MKKNLLFLLAAVPIKSPNGWLKEINPGIGAVGPNLGANFGINFFTNNVANFVVSLALFILFTASLIFLMIGGIKWITSGGDKEGMAKAKNTVTYAIIGLALGLLSFVFISILGNFFGLNLSGGPQPLSQKEIQDCVNLGIKLVDCQQLYH